MLKYLREWWHGVSSRRKRMTALLVFCQRPMVSIGTVAALPRTGHTDVLYPYETQYQSLHRSDLLTRGFANPHTLEDEGDFFVQDRFFEVVQEGPVRHVLFVGYETDKKLVLYPLFLASVLSAIIAFGAAILTRNVATGAQVGGTFGGGVAVVLGYVMWRLS